MTTWSKLEVKRLPCKNKNYSQCRSILGWTMEDFSEKDPKELSNKV